MDNQRHTEIHQAKIFLLQELHEDKKTILV